MRYFQLFTLAVIPTLLLAQAPSWQWARSFPANSYVGAASSLAQDSGYFLSLYEQELPMPWGLVQSPTGLLIHMDEQGEPTAAVAMPPVLRMMRAGDHYARFLITYRDSCVLPSGTLHSPAGIGVAMGVVDRDGSISDVVNLPDLVVGDDCSITDLDLASNGDLLVAGWFQGTVLCGDTTFLEDGIFLCRYTSTAELASAKTIPDPGIGFEPMVRLESDGEEGAYIALQQIPGSDPDPIYGAGTIIASFDADWGLRWARSSTEMVGLYSDGPIHLAKAADGGLYAAYTSGSGAFSPGRVTVVEYSSDGSEHWMNNSFGPLLESSSCGVVGIASSPAFDGPVISIYAIGQMTGYGPFPITTGGNPNAVVAALDSMGNWAWAVSDNGPGNVFGTKAVVSTNGSIYCSGNFEINASFGPHALTSTTPVGLYCARLGYGDLGMGLWASPVGERMTIHPIPALDQLWLQHGAQTGETVQLRDAQVRPLKTILIDRMPFPISVAEFSAGVYFVCVEGRCQRVVVE